MAANCHAHQYDLLVNVGFDSGFEDWVLHLPHEAEVLPLAPLQMKLQLERQLSAAAVVVHGQRKFLVDEGRGRLRRQPLVHAPVCILTNFSLSLENQSGSNNNLKMKKNKKVSTLEVRRRPPRRR